MSQLISWVIAGILLLLYCLVAASIFKHESVKDNKSSRTAGLILLSTFYFIAYAGMIYFTAVVTKSVPNDPTVEFERTLRCHHDPKAALFLV